MRKKNFIMSVCSTMHCIVAFVCAIMLTSCDSDENGGTDSNTVFSEKVMGKWMCNIIDGKPCVTNYNYVLTFISPTKAFRSLSQSAPQSMNSLWNNGTECDVKIEGEKMTITAQYTEDLKTKSEYYVISISETDMVLMSKHFVTYKGNNLDVPEHSTERFKKVTVDYSNDIIGTWEGKMTSQESVYDDGKMHRWEYKADGTYVYYTLNDDGQWERYDNTYANYFVDGVLLCSRWKNNGEDTEQREWWEIESIQNGVMKWTAVRKRDDGTTYTSSFQMTKVQ